jgi:maleylpyruvate isomerase
MRTREVWIHAVDLANGGQFEDFPPEILDALLRDITRVWDQRRSVEQLPVFQFNVTDRDVRQLTSGGEAGTLLRGTAAALVRWASGRGSKRVRTESGDTPPAAPRWL